MMETYIIERLKTIHTIVVMSLSGLLPTYLSRLVSHIISISLQIQVPCLLSGTEHRTLIDHNVQGPPGTPYYRGLPIGRDKKKFCQLWNFSELGQLCQL